MEKSKFCEELKKRGYDAAVDGGVVIVRKAGKVETTVKEIKELAEKLEYNQSIGVRTIAESKVKVSVNAEDNVSVKALENAEEIDEFFDEDEADDLPDDIDEAPKEIDADSFEQMSLF